jgi:hypothetical protein
VGSFGLAGLQSGISFEEFFIIFHFVIKIPVFIYFLFAWNLAIIFVAFGLKIDKLDCVIRMRYSLNTLGLI